MYFKKQEHKDNLAWIIGDLEEVLYRLHLAMNLRVDEGGRAKDILVEIFSQLEVPLDIQKVFLESGLFRTFCHGLAREVRKEKLSDVSILTLAVEIDKNTIPMEVCAGGLNLGEVGDQIFVSFDSSEEELKDILMEQFGFEVNE